MIPGTPGMAGGIHLMLNAFGLLENQGLGGHTITNPGVATGFEGGATRAQLQHDWLMGYAREERGLVEGLLMIDLEPLTVGPAGMPELGQSGEGLWDAQHSHLLFHQAMVAIHPFAWTASGAATMMSEPRWDLSLFAGQGSATMGPPIFMHRASSPGPTVPRKHHKGENPHETSPVIGASFRYDLTTIEASIFGAKELTPDDNRMIPHPSAPTSFAARVRRIVADSVEVQISGERLRDQGEGSRRLAGERQRLPLDDDRRAARGRAARLGPRSARRRAERAGALRGGGGALGRSARGRLAAWRSQSARGAAGRGRRGQLAVAVRDRRLRIRRLGLAPVGLAARRLRGGDVTHIPEALAPRTGGLRGRGERRPAPVRDVDARRQLRRMYHDH
jgi:hypothetical protein